MKENAYLYDIFLLHSVYVFLSVGPFECELKHNFYAS